MEWGIFTITGAELLGCPICDGRLKIYDRRRRQVIIRDSEKLQLLLRRLRCYQCKRLHTELPDFLVPHKRYSLQSIEDVVAGKKSGAPYEERTRSGFCKWYHLIWIDLEAIWQRLVKQKFASPFKTPTFPDLVRAAVNSGFWITHPNGHGGTKVIGIASS